MGQQYQNHNPNPGPVYSGGGYTPISMAIAKFHQEAAAYWAAASAPSAAATPLAPGVLPETATTLGKLLAQHPDLVNDVSTGGALPLHTCGMSRDNQHAAAYGRNLICMCVCVCVWVCVCVCVCVQCYL